MKLSRREFLALGAKATAGTMIFAACGLPERELIVQSPVDMPEDLVRGEDAWYATTWPDMPGGDWPHRSRHAGDAPKRSLGTPTIPST